MNFFNWNSRLAQTTTIPAIPDLGMKGTRGVIVATAMRTNKPVKNEDSKLCDPNFSLSLDLEILPLAGIDWKNDGTKLHTPKAENSWNWFQKIMVWKNKWTRIN